MVPVVPTPEVGPSHVKPLLFAWDARTSTVDRYRNDHEATRETTMNADMDAEIPREVNAFHSLLHAGSLVDSASIMQMLVKDDGRMAKREGLAPYCILDHLGIGNGREEHHFFHSNEAMIPTMCYSNTLFFYIVL